MPTTKACCSATAYLPLSIGFYCIIRRRVGSLTSNEVVEEIKEYNSQFDKSEKFLKNDSWVRQLCEGERLKQARERCKQQEDKVNRGESVSYSKVYKAIELLEKNR